MENNLESIILILEQLKGRKIPASKVEKDLGFSNGLIKKGKLSDKKWEQLIEYWKKHCNANYQTFREKDENGKLMIKTNNPVIIETLRPITKKGKNICFGDTFESAKPTVEVIVNENGKIESPTWVSEIEEICNEENITPDELVKQWKEMKNFEKQVEKLSNDPKFKKAKEEAKENLSTWGQNVTHYPTLETGVTIEEVKNKVDFLMLSRISELITFFSFGFSFIAYLFNCV